MTQTAFQSVLPINAVRNFAGSEIRTLVESAFQAVTCQKYSWSLTIRPVSSILANGTDEVTVPEHQMSGDDSFSSELATAKE